MILVFGSVNVDLVSRVSAIARPGETVLSAGYERFFGGKGANQAVAAARSQHEDAAPVLLCAAVGEDAFGQDCLDHMTAEGIDLSLIQIAPAPTGCAFISVDRSGENAITVASGANGHLVADAIEDALLHKVTVAVLQMETPWRENATLAARAKSAGARVVLNFAPATAEIERSDLRMLLASVDTLVVNEHELATLSRALGNEPDATAAERLANDLQLAIVVTLGADGAMLVQPGVAEWRCAAKPAAIVDTTGAGDTFVGVLATALAEALPLRATIERAGLAATLSCGKQGAQSGMPHRSLIERSLSHSIPPTD